MKRGTPSSQVPIFSLPEPRQTGDLSLEAAIVRRRSVRSYRSASLDLQDVSQLLWAAQGITDPTEGLRSVPSAGALYPLELILVAGNVRELPIGVYRYRPQDHCLVPLQQRDVQSELALAALSQHWVEEAAMVLVVVANYQRTTAKYGQRGIRYVLMEVGHVAQNVYLQCVSLGLGTVFVGAFYDEQVKSVLGLPPQEEPLAILPVGRV
ncbi:MAG: SagB/ThcOx family dehydrogenase [Calditrichaeota bacterium]|nr:SagB/ThcOx family dehydrogenase [Calditrichota bacterium]